jgi:hypothetical protein
MIFQIPAFDVVTLPSLPTLDRRTSETGNADPHARAPVACPALRRAGCAVSYTLQPIRPAAGFSSCSTCSGWAMTRHPPAGGPLGGVVRPRRMVRFARLIDRCVRALSVRSLQVNGW